MNNYGNERKVHYKMYKVGKRWLVAGLTTMTFISSGVYLTIVNADTVNTADSNNNPKQTITTENISDSKTESLQANDSNKDIQNTTQKSSNSDKQKDVNNDDSAKNNVKPTNVDSKQAQVTTNTNNDLTTDQQNKSAKDDLKPSNVDNKQSQTTANNNTVTDNKQSTEIKSANEDQNKAVTNDNKPVTMAENNSPAQASDISVSVTPNENTASQTYSPGNSVAYDIGLHNDSSTGAVIPAGTKITVKVQLTYPENGNLNDFLPFVTSTQDSSNPFSIVKNGDGTFTLTTNQNILPGTATLTLHFTAAVPGPNPQYNWDGKNPDGKNVPTKITASITASYNYDNQNAVAKVTDGNIIIQPNSKSDPNTSAPGYVTGSLNNVDFPLPTGFPHGSSGYIGNHNNQDGSVSNIYLPNVYDSNGQPYVAGISNFNNGVARIKGNRLAIDVANNKISDDTIRIYAYQNGKWVDVTDDEAIQAALSTNSTNVSLDITNLSMNLYGNIDMVIFIPIANSKTSQDDMPSFVGSVGYARYAEDGTLGKETTNATQAKYIFADNADSYQPYFNAPEHTLYSDQTYNPLNDVTARDGINGDLTSSITITNLDGYPADGVNPKAGTYYIIYSVTNKQGVVGTITRTITVLQSQANVNAHGGEIWQGDSVPTDTSWYGATATNDDNSAATITNIDTSKVDNKVPGTYDVTITSSNGLTKTVQIVVKKLESTVIDTATGTEIIHYVDADGKTVASDQVVTAHFTGTGIKNDKTGVITWNWTSTDNNYNVDSPLVTNMTPSQASVSVTIIRDENNFVNVVYNDDMLNVTAEAIGTETIHYVDTDGKTVAPDKVVTAHFTRTGTEDLVNHKVTWNAWTSTDNTYNVVSPAVVNMTPDQANVSGNINANENGAITVKYSSNGTNSDSNGGNNISDNSNNSNKSNNSKTKETFTNKTNKIFNLNDPKINAIKNNEPNKIKDNKNKALPNTGESNFQSILAIIGAILLSVFGLFGLDLNKNKF